MKFLFSTFHVLNGIFENKESSDELEHLDIKLRYCAKMLVGNLLKIFFSLVKCLSHSGVAKSIFL